MKDLEDLQDRLMAQMIGMDFPVIMAALTMLQGALIGQHAMSREYAEAMISGAVAAMRTGLDLWDSQGGNSDVH